MQRQALVMKPHSEYPSFPLIIVDCVHYAMSRCPQDTVGGVGEMAAMRVWTVFQS